MTRHYHVGVNTVGYSCDEPPAMFYTRKEAVAYARSQKREILENGYGPMDPDEMHATGRDGDYYIGDGDTHHLDVHIWTSQCYDDDCEQDD